MNDRSSIIERVFAAAVALSVASASFVVAYFDPVTAGFFPVCPLHQMTGLNCPGCGLTRGFHALFHGDFLSALHYNALLPVYAMIFGYLLISLVLTTVRGRGLSWRFFSPSILYSCLILILLFGVLRNLPFYPFTFFAL